MATEKELHEYNKWLMGVWNPNQLYIPFSIDAPKAFLEYLSKTNRLDKDLIELPKEKTMEEVRDEFLNHIRYLVEYWNNVDERPCREKLDGLAFSILSMLDGSSVDICGFIVAPNPYEDDKKYNIENGNDYYPENRNVNCDIAGDLHDLFYKQQE